MVRRWFPLVLVAAALGCGGPESETGGEAAQDVSAAAGQAAESAREAAAEAEAMAEEAAESEIVANCLDLVSRGKFSEAVPVCTEALGLEPANQKVQQALDKANRETAAAAAAQASEAAKGAAAEEASKAAGKMMMGD